MLEILTLLLPKIVAHAPEAIETGLTMIGGASIIASQTRTKKDDKVLSVLGNILNFLAFNVKHAKNKD